VVDELCLSDVSKHGRVEQIIPNLVDLVSKVEVSIHEGELARLKPSNKILILDLNIDHNLLFFDVKDFDTSQFLSFLCSLLVHNNQHSAAIIKGK
jgi:hypothetical protein